MNTIAPTLAALAILAVMIGTYLVDRQADHALYNDCINHLNTKTGYTVYTKARECQTLIEISQKSTTQQESVA